MAASDPQRRHEAATTAARARVAAMTDEQRRAMTDEARATLRRRDLAAVDNEARRLGQHPLPETTRAFRADVLAAVRARRASDAAKAARRLQRQAEADHEARTVAVRADLTAGGWVAQ